MPSQVVDPNNPANAHTLCVVGQNNSHGVWHVALLASGPRSVGGSPANPVHHVGFSEKNWLASVMFDDMAVSVIPDVIGHLESHPSPGHPDVVDAEAEIAWLSSLSPRSLLSYRAHPPFVESHVFGGLRLVAINCVGLVLLTYKRLGVQLLDNHQQALFPRISLSQLQDLYYPLKHLLSTKSTRKKLGLEPPNGSNNSLSWPIVLPGYLFHALNRQRSSLPFVPQTSAEARFR